MARWNEADHPRSPDGRFRDEWVGRVSDAISGLVDLPDREDRQSVRAELSRQAKLTPRAFSQFRGVTTFSGEDTKQDLAADYKIGDRKIHVRRGILGEAGARTRYGGDRKKGGSTYFAPTGKDISDLRSFIAHEYGHHVDFTLSQADRHRLLTFAAAQLGIPRPPKSPAAAETASRQFSEWWIRHYPRLNSAISRRANANDKELLAEIWAEYSTNPKARPAVKAIGERMRQLAEGET